MFAAKKSAGTVASGQIEKSFDALSAKDVEQNWPAVQKAMRKELAAFDTLKTFRRIPKSASKNHCTSRWVLRWKQVDGERIVKARLTIRGFQDVAHELTTYAATASRLA